MNAASVILSGPNRFDRRDRRVATLPMDQPLPERRATHRRRVISEGSNPISANQDDARRCTHWPEGGVDRIQAAARTLHVLAEGITPRGVFLTPVELHSGCLDLDMLAAEPIDPTLSQRFAALAVQVEAQKRSLRLLADDFATVSTWLTRAAELNWDAGKTMRQHWGLVVALGENQRLVSKDSLSADVNALTAAMLQRAAALLDRLDFAADSVKADPAAQRSVQRVLRQAAVLLDTAATLADAAENLVAEFDRRWRLVRHQVALAFALAGNPATSADSTP